MPKKSTKPSTAARKSLGTLSSIMKADKAADAKMTPAMMKKDIAADKKALAAKLAKAKGGDK